MALKEALKPCALLSASVDSLGVTGEGTHSTEERAEIASLAECAKRLAAVAVCL